MTTLTITIRRLTNQDKPALTELYLALDSDSVHRRFGVALSCDARSRYVGKLDFNSMYAIGAFDGSTLVAACEAFPLNGSNDSPLAELAFVVLPHYQGNRLGLRLGEAVRSAMPGDLLAVCVVPNPPMVKLAKRLGFVPANQASVNPARKKVLSEFADYSGVYLNSQAVFA